MIDIRESDEVAQFARAEMAHAKLGDRRLDARLGKIVSSFAARPDASIPSACCNWAGAKGAYRFFGNKRVTPEKILEPHVEQAIERSREHDLVLAIGDTTYLDFSQRKEMEGIGPLTGRKTTGLGLVVHSTILASASGIPLGVADNRVWARDEEGYGKGPERCRELPIEQKESSKWLRSLEVASDIQERVGSKTKIVATFDREGDIYSVLGAARDRFDVDLLIRAQHPRKIKEDPEGRALWSFVESNKVGEIEISVPRGKGKKSRVAVLALYASPVTLQSPPKRPKGENDYGPIEVFAIHAKEITPDRKSDLISWRLLTTLPIDSLEDSLRAVELYSRRWLIEQHFRVLKSGCKIEERQFEEADRLANCLAADSIVAWMVLYLTIVGRETPDLPCTVIFEECEWKAVWVYVNQKPDPPETPPSLGEFVALVGRLGGHLGRKGDGYPGSETLWKGLRRVPDLAGMWLVMRNIG